MFDSYWLPDSTAMHQSTSSKLDTSKDRMADDLATHEPSRARDTCVDSTKCARQDDPLYSGLKRSIRESNNDFVELPQPKRCHSTAVELSL
jgi:hypothetical protein